MNDLKQLIHEASMHYASETSNSVDEFVGAYIIAFTKFSARLSEIDDICKTHPELN